MKNIKSIILAAGKGVRMNSKTPKVLHPLCGRPMIAYVLELTRSLGLKDSSIVLGHQNELVGKCLSKDINVIIQKKLLGTADAIKQAAPNFKNFQGDILVLCGDAPLLRKETVEKLVQSHQESKSVCTVLTSYVDRPTGYGRVIRSKMGEVLAIREEKDASENEKRIREINTGVYCFQAPELFKAVGAIKLNEKKKEFYLTDIVEYFVKNSKTVKAVVTEDSGEGLGINTREDLALAEKILRKRILRNFMLNGVTIIDPETTYIDHDVTIGQDTVIRPFSVIENHVKIGEHCVIGPFCHLRSHSEIGDHTEVGNFTEVSRTKMGDHCFMKHFSFLGDCVAGNRVNIGAGVVTANFDGKNKNETKIGDDAFIGSDSILVAPLKVGKKAVTGAGCVVTKNHNVPDGAVAVGVPAKIIK